MNLKINFSTNISNLHDDTYFSRESPVACWKLNIISAYCVVLFTSSFITNGLLLLVFWRCKELRRASHNSYILVFTVLSFIGTLAEAPVVILSNFYCRWIWGRVGCIASAFVMYFIASTQTLILTSNSIDRTTFLTIVICVLVGLFCASAPLLGWSYYSLEGALTSCSVEWNERSLNVISYNIFIFCITFLIPLIIITYCNLSIVFVVNKHKNDKLTKTDEFNVNLIMIAYVVCFIFSWTPYAVVSFYAAFLGNDLPPLAGTLPAMLAKSEFLWSSLVFIWSNRIVRIKLKEFLCSNQQSNDSKLLKPNIQDEPTVFHSAKKTRKRKIFLNNITKISSIKMENTPVTGHTYSFQYKEDNQTNNFKYPIPLFKNDPVYMKGFNDITENFQTNIVNFNLKYLVDRIKMLQETKTEQRDLSMNSSHLELQLKNNLSNLLKKTTDSTKNSSQIKNHIAQSLVNRLRDNFQLQESTTQVESGTKVFISSCSESFSNFQSLPLSTLIKKISFTSSTSNRHSYNLRSTVGTNSKTKSCD